VPVILRGLIDEDNGVVQAAHEAIGSVGDAGAPQLLAVMHDASEREELRGWAAAMLAERGDAGLAYLIPALADPDFQIVSLAVEAIPSAGARADRVGEALAQVLQDSSLAPSVANGLAIIAAANPAPESSCAYSFLCRALRDPDPRLRLHAVHACAYLPPPLGT